MSGLRNLVDKLKPTFSEGGKLSFLASTFDAFETFLFVPNTTTQKGAHIRDCNDMKRTMIVVVVALLPALLFGMYKHCYQVGMTGWVRPLSGSYSFKWLPMTCCRSSWVWASSSLTRQARCPRSQRGLLTCRVC